MKLHWAPSANNRNYIHVNVQEGQKSKIELCWAPGANNRSYFHVNVQEGQRSQLKAWCYKFDQHCKTYLDPF